jgi:hypothetical protein
MKIFAIIAAIAISTSAAYADPVTVVGAKKANPTKKKEEYVSEKEAQDYVARLDLAVKDVCYQAAAPMIGLNHSIYLACIKATRAKVAQDDPTGIYASKSAPLVLAAN